MGGGDVNVPGPTKEEKALQKEQTELLRLQRDSIQTQQEFNKLITPVLLKEAGFEFEMDDKGNIVEIRESTDPNDVLRKDIERGLLERTDAALKGELPVDPGLLRDLDKFDQDLENKLRKQFGDLTSTPAQEALQRARESRETLLSQARRGDLTLAEQLGVQRQQANEMLIDSTINRGLAIGNSGNIFANQFAQTAQGAAQAQQPFQFNRQMQFNAALQNAQSADPFGSIFGSVLGSFAGGAGSSFGAGLFG